MSDEIDLAQEKEEISLAYAIRRAREATGRVPVATGRCLYCDEILADGQRWCIGTGCREALCKLTGAK